MEKNAAVKIGKLQKVNVRFAVGSAGGPRSLVWRVVSKGNDVYVFSGLAKVAKLSLHASGICRRAFTSEFGTPDGMTDRAMHKWRRAPTPPAGMRQFSLVAKIHFPTKFLSTALAVTTKQVMWIPAATEGSRAIGMGYTYDDEKTFHSLTKLSGLNLLTYNELPSGEAFCLLEAGTPTNEVDFIVRASHSEKRNLMVSENDSDETGRPVRMQRFDNPKDGDVLNGAELGGFWSDTPLENYTGPTFSRATVLQRQWEGGKH